MKKSNFKILVSAILIMCSVSVFGQMHLVDNIGKPLDGGKYTDIDGSPYLNDNWLKGTVKLNDGTTYKDIDLKFDLVTCELQFKNKNGDALTFIDPVKEFTIRMPEKDLLFRSDYNKSKNLYYAVLADGTVQFLKLFAKEITENREYNSATVTKSIRDNYSYYIFKGGKLTGVKKSKKAILTAIGDKQPELEAYIKSENLDLSVENDIAKLVLHYNSL